ARAVDVPVAGCRIRIADGFHFLRPPVPSPIASTGMLNCQAALPAFMAIRSCELPRHCGLASTACSSQRRPAKRGKLGVHRWENRMPLHKISSMRRRLLLTPIGTGMVMALNPWLAAAQPGNAKMPIGIIGSGRIGGTIGGLWVKAGHPVLFSSRHPDQLKDLVTNLGPLAKAGSVADAIKFGEVMFIAVPYAALPEIGRDYGAALNGKILLDACNAVEARDGDIAQEADRDGVGVTSQKYLPGARLVRAFNTMSYTIFAREANRPEPRLAVPIAGDDPEAVKVAQALVRDAGFEPVLVGKLVDAARFQRGAPGYGQQVTADELRKKLSLAP